MLLQQVVLDADPEEAAAAAAREAAEHGMDWLTPRLLLDTQTTTVPRNLARRDACVPRT